MEVKFHPHVLKTDVVAVKFVGNHILTGIGGTLNVFKTSGELLLKVEVFQGQKIHGLCVELGGNVALWGGLRIAVCSLQCEGDRVHITKPVSWLNNDWIHQLHWLDDNQVALLTAHNELSLWDANTQRKLKCIVCAEKCIIYSGLIVGSSWSDLVVMVGTVFQEVIVWMVGGSLEAAESPVLHRLQGHKGVIFSVAWDSASRRVVTTSDDRSVRVWSVHGPWTTAAVRLDRTLYGHKARVWKSAVVGDAVVSVGEDSQLCVWGAEGQLVGRWATHQGGKVWGLDCSEELGLLVTVGGDGGVHLWPLPSWTDELTPATLPLPPTTTPRRVALGAGATKMAVTTCGAVLARTPGRGGWEVADRDDRLSSYNVLDLSPCKLFLALGTLDGHVLVYQVKHDSPSGILKVTDQRVVSGKVFSLHWLSSDSLMTCGSSGRLDVWKFTSSRDLEGVKTLTLPKSREHWTSAALLVEGVLLCGDRGGGVHAYDLAGRSPLPSPSFPRIHGRLGVCSLARHEGTVFSTGRDGTVRRYEFRDGQLELLTADKLPVEWVARTVPSQYGMLVLLFHEVHFVVWSWAEQRNILEIDCGGGHRSWDFSLDQANNVHFLFVKDKMIHSVEFPLDKLVKPVLEDGFHPREVGSMRVVPRGGGNYPLLVSGGEDTTVRLSLVGPDDRLQTLAILRSHISSVRALALFPLQGEDGFLLFSAGGRAQLKAWRLRLAEPPGVTWRQTASHMLRGQERRPWREARTTPAVDVETRYMDLCAFPSPSGGGSVLVAAGCSDGVLRLFSYTTTSEAELHLVTEYPVHHKRCVLHVGHLPAASPLEAVVSMATDGRVAFWPVPHETGALPDPAPFGDLRVHQSGINSFDWLRLESGRFLLATGGDDNALVLTVLELRMGLARPEVHVIGQRKVESMHAAQVTGLRFANGCLVSACIDQRVRVWTWVVSVDNHSIECSLVGEYCSTVPDIRGLEVFETRFATHLCVYGKGMEIIETQLRRREKNET